MATLKGAKIMPGTTPILNALVEGVDITEATVYVSIVSGDTIVMKSNYYEDGVVLLDEAYDGSTWIGTDVTVRYSQSDTLCLRPGNAKVQIGWVFDDDTADKTDMGRLFVPNTIIGGVMRYGRHNTEDE